MKKLLIIITLFVSSFFLFCNKEVKAYTYTSEVDFSVMEDVLSLKEKLDAFIKTDTNYSDYYIISYYQNKYMYYIFPLDYSFSNFSFQTSYSDYFYIQYKASLPYGTNLDVITITSSISNRSFYLAHNEGTQKFRYYYSNFELYYPVISHISSVTYTYNDFSYTSDVKEGNKVLTLYDVYLEYQNQLGNIDEIHKEELEKVGSFYNIVIEKLGYLAETIASNYIYLSIIVIFILIFVFLLIFRRFL